jgi:hypothetical protein
MEQSHIPQANILSVSQKIPLVLWNTTVYYRVHKSPTLIPTLSQMSPVNISPQYFSKIH